MSFEGGNGKERQEHEGRKTGSLIGFMRHSIAGYAKAIEGIINRPLQAVPISRSTYLEDYKDLTPEGKELAERAAKKLLDGMDPENDVLYIASSPTERAVETAAIVLRLARERGFTIVDHGEKGLRDQDQSSKVAAHSQIRTFPALASLDMKIPAWIADLFTPRDIYAHDLKAPLSEENIDRLFINNWGVIGETEEGQLTVEQQNAWKRAKQIIINDDKGTWVSNLVHHAPKIIKEFKDDFPELVDPIENSMKQLAVMTRMFRWGLDKFKSNPENANKSLKVLVFGHEEYMAALEDIFGEGGHNIENCEVTSLIPREDGAFTIKKGGEERNATFSQRGWNKKSGLGS